MQILVFLDKDQGYLWLESGYCSNILNLFWSWESAIQMWTRDKVVPGGSAGNQDGCQAGGIYLKMALGAVEGERDLLSMLGDQLWGVPDFPSGNSS